MKGAVKADSCVARPSGCDGDGLSVSHGGVRRHKNKTATMDNNGFAPPIIAPVLLGPTAGGAAGAEAAALIASTFTSAELILSVFCKASTDAPVCARPHSGKRAADAHRPQRAREVRE